MRGHRLGVAPAGPARSRQRGECGAGRGGLTQARWRQQTGQHLVAVQCGEHLAGPGEQAQQQLVGELRRSRHGGELGIHPRHEVTRQYGQGGPQPSDPPRRAEPAHGRAGVEPGDERPRRREAADQLEVDGDAPGHRHHHR
jgi:hypothetical protein